MASRIASIKSAALSGFIRQPARPANAVLREINKRLRARHQNSLHLWKLRPGPRQKGEALLAWHQMIAPHDTVTPSGHHDFRLVGGTVGLHVKMLLDPQFEHGPNRGCRSLT